MNSVERVRAICAERKIPISKLERDLGFSNGYIGQLRKGTFPADRLALIAEYLSLSTDYLLNGEEKEKPALTASLTHLDDEFTYAMFEESRNLTPEYKKRLLEMAKFFRQQQENEK